MENGVLDISELIFWEKSIDLLLKKLWNFKNEFVMGYSDEVVIFSKTKKVILLKINKG